MESQEQVRERAAQLKAAGHAISYAEAFEGQKFAGYAFTHYTKAVNASDKRRNSMAKNGKWAGFKDKLQPFKQEDSWQQKIDEMKSQFVGCDTAELARALVMARNFKQGHEERVKSYNTEIEALSQLLVDNLESSEIQKVGLATGETVYLQSEPYATVTDKPKVMAWLKKHKMQALFSIHWKSYNSLIKEMLIDGKPVPDGTSVFMKTSARITGRGEQNEN